MAEYLTGTLQHARHVGVVFQNEDLQSMWQSVEQGRKNFRGMWEMLFQSEELRSMWQSTVVPLVS